ALVAWALAENPRRWLPPTAGALLVPCLLLVPTFLTALTTFTSSGGGAETTYDAMSHLNWFFKNQRHEGQLGVALPLAVTALLLATWWLNRHAEPRGPAAAVFALVVLYLFAPKTLSGSWLFAMRFPGLIALLVLCVADVTRLPRLVRGAVLVGSAISLVETLAFHHHFARAVDGLEVVTAAPPSGIHGYLSVQGAGVLESRNVYAEHLGQWWTARHGGVGHNFFADTARYPVRFRPGVHLAERVENDPDAFDTVLVFGDEPLPAFMASWHLEQQAGRWRRLSRGAAR
ncbi:MAG: hypothetical protein JNG84_12700, partial [Archangium sp.]|nr:hypothetical protein [Archangium sp.]